MSNRIQTQDPTFYFAHGSNLWEHQMQQRCPTSRIIGLAKVKGYRWFISSTGSANIEQDSEAETFGLLYSIKPADEAVLDSREGVPDRHTKEINVVSLWSQSTTGSHDEGDPQQVEEGNALVYIDRKNLQDGQPKKEYIYRMNQGIQDAVARGMPQAYVDGVMRKYMPETWDRDAEDEAKRRILVSAAWDAQERKQ